MLPNCSAISAQLTAGPSGIRQTVEQPKCSQQILVADHHGLTCFVTYIVLPSETDQVPRQGRGADHSEQPAGLEEPAEEAQPDVHLGQVEEDAGADGERGRQIRAALGDMCSRRRRGRHESGHERCVL